MARERIKQRVEISGWIFKDQIDSFLLSFDDFKKLKVGYPIYAENRFGKAMKRVRVIVEDL